MTDLKVLVKIPLVISSYTILWFILLILMMFNGLEFIYMIIGTILVILSAITTPLLLILVEREKKVRLIYVEEKENVSIEYLVYFVPYFVPLVVFLVMSNIKTSSLLLSLIIIFLVLFIYIVADKLYINILFLFYGYKPIKVKDNHGNVYILLMQHDIIRNRIIDVYEFSNNLMLGIDENAKES